MASLEPSVRPSLVFARPTTECRGRGGSSPSPPWPRPGVCACRGLPYLIALPCLEVGELVSNGVAVVTRASDWTDWEHCPPFGTSRVTKVARQVKTRALPALAPPWVTGNRGSLSSRPARVLGVYERLAVEATKEGWSGENRQREVVHSLDDKEEQVLVAANVVPPNPEEGKSEDGLCLRASAWPYSRISNYDPRQEFRRGRAMSGRPTANQVAE